jgi:hypothetical protein
LIWNSFNICLLNGILCSANAFKIYIASDIVGYFSLGLEIADCIYSICSADRLFNTCSAFRISFTSSLNKLCSTIIALSNIGLAEKLFSAVVVGLLVFPCLVSVFSTSVLCLIGFVGSTYSPYSNTSLPSPKKNISSIIAGISLYSISFTIPVAYSSGRFSCSSLSLIKYVSVSVII